MQDQALFIVLDSVQVLFYEIMMRVECTMLRERPLIHSSLIICPCRICFIAVISLNIFHLGFLFQESKAVDKGRRVSDTQVPMT